VAIRRKEKNFVGYRLINQKNPSKRLSLSTNAWYVSLESAENSGWNPMGAVPEIPAESESFFREDYWYIQELDTQAYIIGDGSTVLLEDALNLADALDRVFLTYEPKRVDWSLEYFNGFFYPAPKLHPSIGTIKILANFCRYGAFRILRM
jgi:hypothetical protein